MDPAKLQPDEIFCAAIELATPEERAAYLEQVCGDDLSTRRRVERLLEAHSLAGGFLGTPPAVVSGTTDLPAESVGTVIGPYKLLQSIGEGGMGDVWMAEQTRPVQRKVALKIIKAGMDSRQVLARFEAERQALALMDHPNVAKVLDGGATATGRPYFVMELVKGQPITQYCDEQRLSPHQRLELFVSVCHAIQHAHQKGIIHRDIKPSNVLVAPYDGKPVVKIIDFGVAKATGQRLTEKTLFTELGAVVGTLEYMSPEQAELNNHDIDTRSDIYALGVLLYELLTGTTPLTRQQLRQAAFTEMLRLIREQEPPKPSTRLSDSKDSLPSISAQRHMEPAKLTKLVRGDLDWIVMKALEKDRNRRYETANGFAADVHRYLADEPVQACPPSFGYRLRKFVRRNRRVLITGTLMVLLLLLALGAVAGSLVWRARERAARQTETERELLEALAQTEAYLRETDKQIDDPVRWQMTVKLADGAAQQAERLLATGEARAELVERTRRLGAALEAERRDSSLVAALERVQLEMAAEPNRNGQVNVEWAAPRYAALLRDYGVDPATPTTAAERVRGSRLREPLLAALEFWRRVTPDAAERQRLETLLEAAEPAADALRQRWTAAVRRHDAIALVQVAGEPAVQQLPMQAVLNLARDLRGANQLAAAEQLLRVWQERYPGNFWLNHELGRVLQDQKPPRTAEAIRYLTAASALRNDNSCVYQNLGNALRDAKDLDGAIRAFQAAIKLDPNFASPHVSLGAALFDKKDVEGAIREYQTALKLDPNYALAYYNLGIALYEKDLEGAIRAFQAALKIWPNHALSHYMLGVAHYKKGDVDGTIREFQAAVECDPSLIDVQVNLGLALVLHKRDAEGAERAFRAALKLDPNYARAHFGLAQALQLRDDKDVQGPLREFQLAVKLDPSDAEAQWYLGLRLYALKRYAEALAALEVADRLGAQRPGWRFPTEPLYRFKRFCELNIKLAQVLTGDYEPANVGERLLLASFCQENKQLFATAAAWYAEAFDAEPAAANDLKAGHRYNAACAAALAGVGQGRDAGKLKDEERTRCRKQALAWLRADLNAWKKRLESNQPAERETMLQMIQHWQDDSDLAGVRNADALQKLPAQEQEEWRKLWADVTELLKKAGNSK